MLSIGESSFGFVLRNKIYLIASIVVTWSIATACNSQPSEQENLQKKLSSAPATPKLDCLEGRDTTFPNNDFLRFVTLSDTTFDLKVGIDGKEVLLGFRFGCNGPNGLIPRVLKHSANQMILVRGYGFHYREIIIWSLRQGNIDVQRFESTLAIGANYDVAYPDTDDPSKIIVTDLLTNKHVVLLMRQRVDSIRLFQITENSVVVVDNKGEELVLPFKR